MPLTVLNVAFPLSPVGNARAGGAEQILMHLDAGLTSRGHRSLVIAQEGSRVCGTLVPVPRPPEALSHQAFVRAEQAHREAIASVLARERVDVVHLHGVDFFCYLPRTCLAPVVVTLHLPRACYQPEARDLRFPGVRFVCVSRSQLRSWPNRQLDVVDNGVPLDRFGAAISRRQYVLLLGRICPEKGWHLALDAARRAGIRAVLAGSVQGFPEHERYFHEEIRPWLQRGRAVYIGAAEGTRKRRLLGAARCVVISSQVPETSSLAAIEALASGTPVVAFARGALPDLVEHGHNGFLVDNVDEMADAIQHVGRLDPEACRQTAVARFDANRMVDAYLALYARETASRAAASVA